MKLSSIVPAPIVIFVASRDVRWRDGQLGSDFVERVLCAGESELALEQRRLGGVPVRAGEIQSLRGINELLCLLHYVCKIGKHDVGFGVRRAWRRSTALVVSALAVWGEESGNRRGAAEMVHRGWKATVCGQR